MPCPQCSVLCPPPSPFGEHSGQPPLLLPPLAQSQERAYGAQSKVLGTLKEISLKASLVLEATASLWMQRLQLKECILGISGMEMEQDLTWGEGDQGRQRDMGTRPPPEQEVSKTSS